MLPGGFEVGNDHLAELAAALVKASPDAIVAGPALPLRALQAVTRTVPLVGMTEDMVAEGLVASFARPGGNITGISLLSPELGVEHRPQSLQMRQQGKTRFLGLTAIGDTAALHQVIDARAFDSAQVVYNMLNPSAAAELPANYPAQDYGRLFDHTRAAGVGVAV